MSDLLAGKTALVTGSSQGIGLAIADCLAGAGAQVWGLDRQPGQTIQADLSDLDSLPGVVAALPGVPDIVVHAAGICPTRGFFDVDVATFRKTLEINLLAPFVLTQEIARLWVAEGNRGVVVNIASNSGFVGKLEQLDYGASKAALISLTRSAALSLGPHGIRVNAIAPGVIDTPLTQEIAARRATLRGVEPAATLAPVLATLPLGRMGKPVEVAQLALFLASDLSSFVTGQTYLVDGGQLMR